MENKNKDFTIPPHIINSLAKVLLPIIQNYFETEKGKKDYENWIAENKKNLETQIK